MIVLGGDTLGISAGCVVSTVGLGADVGGALVVEGGSGALVVGGRFPLFFPLSFLPPFPAISLSFSIE